MTKNMATLDRILRTLIVLGVIVLYASGKITGLAAIVLGILAVAFLLTSLAGSCPVYSLLGISTRKRRIQI